MCMPDLCSNQRNFELMSRATFEQRRNNSGSYCVAFKTASQHCANVNWHWTYIGPMSDISNVGVTNVGPTLNRCSKMMIRRWPNVNPTVGSTIPRWATLHWPNVECQRWSNITDVIGPTLGQRTLAIWVYLCLQKYYVDILIKELGLHSLPGNPTYNLTDFSASEVLDNHKSVLTSFGIQTNNEELDLPYITFRRCTKIHISIDSLRVHRSVRPSLCQFYSQNCLHILSKVSRSTARQPTQGVGSIRCGSSKIQKNY